MVLHAFQQQLRTGAGFVQHAKAQPVHRHRGLDAQLRMVFSQFAVSGVKLFRSFDDTERSRRCQRCIDRLVKPRFVVQQMQHLLRRSAQYARALRRKLFARCADETGFLAGDKNPNTLGAAEVEAPCQVSLPLQSAGLDGGFMRGQKSRRMGIRAAAHNLIIAGFIRLTNKTNGSTYRRKCFIEPDTRHRDLTGAA